MSKVKKKKLDEEGVMDEMAQEDASSVAPTPLSKEEEYLNDLKRLQADFENYKRRQAESQKELKGFLVEKVVSDITPVLDNFYQATSFIPEDQKDSSFIAGIMYIQKQLEDALKNHGLSIIEVKEGDVFDPALHEAVAGEGSVVAKVLQPGYKLGERVVKPARVNVSS